MSGFTVFVADTRHAKIFELSKPGDAPKALETLANNHTARFDRDIGADAPGSVMTRSGNRGGGSGSRRTSLQPRRSHKQHAVEQFARELAERVTHAALNNHGDGVILIAAPRFLAEVRGHLPKSTLRKIVREVPRDLVGLPTTALQQRLAEALGPYR